MLQRYPAGSAQGTQLLTHESTMGTQSLTQESTMQPITHPRILLYTNIVEEDAGRILPSRVEGRHLMCCGVYVIDWVFVIEVESSPKATGTE